MRLPNFLEDELFNELLKQMRPSRQHLILNKANNSENITPIEISGNVETGFIKNITRFFQPKLKLDKTKIEQISKATGELFNILSDALQGNEAGDGEGLGNTGQDSAKASERLHMLFSDSINELDEKYYAFLEVLIDRDTIEPDIFELLVREHYLMPLATIDVINMWADEYLGDYLLDVNDSPYRINKELIPQREVI